MKNEKLNLAELLKDCPTGTKLYSPIFGEVELKYITESKTPIAVEGKHGLTEVFMSDGRYINLSNAECLLFPSKDQRDWNVWKEEQDKKQSNTLKEGDYGITPYKEIYRVNSIIDSNTNYAKALRLDTGVNYNYPIKDLTKIDKYPTDQFKPFDRVLARFDNNCLWRIGLFSHLVHVSTGRFQVMNNIYAQCVPYNEETKHLVGTAQKAPEFYINWRK